MFECVFQVTFFQGKLNALENRSANVPVDIVDIRSNPSDIGNTYLSGQPECFELGNKARTSESSSLGVDVSPVSELGVTVSWESGMLGEVCRREVGNDCEDDGIPASVGRIVAGVLLIRGMMGMSGSARTR